MHERRDRYRRRMSTTSTTTNPPRPFSFRWWTGDRGFGGIAQPPNPSIAVWAIASVLIVTGHAGSPDRAQLLSGIATGALLVWSLDEVFRGVSPIRRIMGAVVLAAVVVRHLA